MDYNVCFGRRGAAAGVAALVAVAMWLVALWGVADSEGVWAVCGWVFLAAKGVMLASTAVAMAVRPALAWRVWMGRYRFDYENGRGVWQAATRLGWELPQLWVGYVLAQWRVARGDVVRVDTLEGVTFVTGRNRDPHTSTGMSAGCFVQLWLPDRWVADFGQYAWHGSDGFVRHEYGHTVDSQLWGWLYLPVVGVPSLVSQWLALGRSPRHRHESFWPERRADRLGARYFVRRQPDAQAQEGQA